MNNKPKVSVIVPIYKAEKYIERCADSLFTQSLDNVEYIFVDDCSPDCSMELLHKTLERYPDRQNYVHFIRNYSNIGVGSSRQVGLEVATGEYIIHCDPDDWIEPNMYERLYSKAIEVKADVVWCNYVLEYSTGSKKIKVQEYDSDLLLHLAKGEVQGHLWNKLIRADFINSHNICFQKGLNICEDWFFCIRVFNHNPVIATIGDYSYHYDKHSNLNALTGRRAQHRKVQNDLLYHAISHELESENTSRKTAICYIAYWAFAHNVLSKEDYKKCYRKHIFDVITSKRKLRVKIPVILSLLGLHSIVFKVYSDLIRLR